MPHIITASLGRDHITSANARHYHAGTLGNGAYVLPMRGRLACSMVNSNTLRVMSGDAVLCGCHWAIDGDYEDYNVENGVPGYSRIDLLVARVSLSPRESVELIVRKGEEVAGEPVAPSWVDGDLNDGDTVAEMPICTVRVSGINASDPEMLVWESPTFVGHKHSASDVTSGTLPATRGGTGQTSLQATRNAMGLGNTTGALPLANGGTGATAAAAARTNLGVPPTAHASTGTGYGIGTSANYGHVKLSDAVNSTSAASAGVAASPKAVKTAYDVAAAAKAGWDSVSQPPSFACTMANCTGSGVLKGYKVGRLVTLYMTGIPSLSAELEAWSGRQVATVPAGYRPAVEVWLPATFDRAAGYVTIAVSGVVTIHARESSLPKGHGFAVGGSYVS